MSIHYGKCDKCGCMGGLNNKLVCLDCVDEKNLLSKWVKEESRELRASHKQMVESAWKNKNKLDKFEELEQENEELKRQLARHAKDGEKNGRAILTEKDVERVMELISIGMKQKEIAILFGVNKRTISAINNGKAWKHVVERVNSIDRAISEEA